MNRRKFLKNLGIGAGITVGGTTLAKINIEEKTIKPLLAQPLQRVSPTLTPNVSSLFDEVKKILPKNIKVVDVLDPRLKSVMLSTKWEYDIDLSLNHKARGVVNELEYIRRTSKYKSIVLYNVGTMATRGETDFEPYEGVKVRLYFE